MKLQLEDDVAKFLDAAPDGVALFSLGTFAHSMMPEQVRIFADGFAMLPHRVLWQNSFDLPAEVKLGNNTKVVKWLPLAKAMGKCLHFDLRYSF